MPILTAEIARCYDNSNVKVDKLRLSASSRVVGGQMNITVYGNEMFFVFYMLCNIVKGSLHRIVEPCSCNLYLRLVCISE